MTDLLCPLEEAVGRLAPITGLLTPLEEAAGRLAPITGLLTPLEEATLIGVVPNSILMVVQLPVWVV